MAEKGYVSNTYANGRGIWHAEVEASEGNGEREVYGCSWATVRNRASAAIKAEIDSRQAKPSPKVKVEFVGMFRRVNGDFVALFKEQ